MPKSYDPFNWYWFVGGETASVYSSLVGDYVSPEDAAFVAWAEDGTSPTNIISEIELGQVLAAYSLRPKPAGVLDAYKDKQASDIIAKADFKPIFKALQEIANLKGEVEPTVATAVAWVKEHTL